jgi:ribosomal protein S27E
MIQESPRKGLFDNLHNFELLSIKCPNCNHDMRLVRKGKLSKVFSCISCDFVLTVSTKNNRNVSFLAMALFELGIMLFVIGFCIGVLLK